MRDRLRQDARYLWYILRHKWHVGRACAREGLFVRAVTHDLSKFCASEWHPYRQYFYGTEGEKNRQANKDGIPAETGCRPFDMAWLMHQHRNDHHPQHWILRKDDGSEEPLPMSEPAMIEMLCDWYGAGAAIHGEASWVRTYKWFKANGSRYPLHPMTRARVHHFLLFKAVEESDPAAHEERVWLGQELVEWRAHHERGVTG